jgi:hypothetical protein
MTDGRRSPAGSDITGPVPSMTGEERSPLGNRSASFTAQAMIEPDRCPR